LQALFESAQHIYEKRKGSGWPKNMRILRIRIPNTGLCLPDKFLESPVLALDEAVGALALHGLGLLPLGIEDAELELGPHLALVARHCQPGHPSINQF
jgi:hypothetical protein